jgi:hypothetical protein
LNGFIGKVLATDNTTNMSDDSSTNNTPSKAMMAMLAPDGYYTYLNIPKARISTGDKETSQDTVDLDVVKRNYRKLSIRVSGISCKLIFQNPGGANRVAIVCTFG